MSRGRYIALGVFGAVLYAAIIVAVHQIAANAPGPVLAKGDRLDICPEACVPMGAAP